MKIIRTLVKKEGDYMGTSRYAGLPMRASRAVMAAVLTVGLIPWGGVAVADELAGDSSGGVAAQSANSLMFCGAVYASSSWDSDGYPIYDENGNQLYDTWTVNVNEVQSAGDTLYVSRSIDITVTDQDGTQSVKTGITPNSLYLKYNENGQSQMLGNLKHLVLEDASQLSRLTIDGLPSLESIEIKNGGEAPQLTVASCGNLRSIAVGSGRITWLSLSDCPSLLLAGVSSSIFKDLMGLSIGSYSEPIEFD